MNKSAMDNLQSHPGKTAGICVSPEQACADRNRASVSIDISALKNLCLESRLLPSVSK